MQRLGCMIFRQDPPDEAIHTGWRRFPELVETCCRNSSAAAATYPCKEEHVPAGQQAARLFSQGRLPAACVGRRQDSRPAICTKRPLVFWRNGVRTDRLAKASKVARGEHVL